MSCTISAETHKSYALFTLKDLATLIDYCTELRTHAVGGGVVPYNTIAFTRHASLNIDSLCVRASRSLLEDGDLFRVPASILLWMFRAANVTRIPVPIPIPHVYKQINPDTKEPEFYVVTKDEWVNGVNQLSKDTQSTLTISDHAKLQYLIRVLGMDIDHLLKDFPDNLLEQEPTVLTDGRKVVIVDDHSYILEGDVCVTVLAKGMSVT